MEQITDEAVLPRLPAGLPDGGRGARRQWHSALAWPAGLLVLVSIFIATDLLADIRAGMSRAHFEEEGLALVLLVAGVVGTGYQILLWLRRATALQQSLAQTQGDLVRWRGEAEGLLHGLGAAIDRQFDRWQLTAAEREVGLLILKGLSYKDAARVRETSERTVRHQALSIYRKAGLAGRAEMAAFFLEDLLLPREQGEPAAGPPPASARAG